MVVCGIICLTKPLQSLKKLTPWITAAALIAGLCVTVTLLRGMGTPEEIGAAPMQSKVVSLFQWIDFTASEPSTAKPVVGPVDSAVKPITESPKVGPFIANFSFFIDSLTLLMLLVITGVGTLIVIYAGGYMAGDPGYARFFAYVSLFIFAMLCIVMADNLLLLYLGWEGVGLASYLLIGFYYKKPTAVAAAKKAFIVNRIGDLGFALGIMSIYVVFGSIEYKNIIPAAQALLGQITPDKLSESAAASYALAQTYYSDFYTSGLVIAAPFLLLMGAAGKSAQIPLYVWLPDAMEGPTPVSALIHAATMVTSGVYMISRLFPIFELSPDALPVVAWIGGLTALLGAVIALGQTDLKRIWAYSTVSQLGYMFLGVGVASVYGGMFHLMTHAMFKALLFLTAGSVMHALAGQLDLHKISGLRHKMPLTTWLMFAGALSLAGFPWTSGFYSKDTILADAYLFSPALGVIGLVTALLTAFYAFRLWFRVFMGPTHYTMGNEHHGAEDPYAPHVVHYPSVHVPPQPLKDGEYLNVPTPPEQTNAAVDALKSVEPTPIKVEHHHDAHEMPFYMNAPLIVLAIGALAFGFFGAGWVEKMVLNSTAKPFSAMELYTEDHIHNVHHTIMYISGAVAIMGILLAGYYHWSHRAAGDKLASNYKGLATLLYNKLYIDEIYQGIFVTPLHKLSQILFVFDTLIVDGLVLAIASIPRVVGTFTRRQHGSLQGYAVGMAMGVAILILLIAYAL